MKVPHKCLVLGLLLLAVAQLVHGDQRVSKAASRLGKRIMMRTMHRNKYHFNNVADNLRFTQLRHRLGGRLRRGDGTSGSGDVCETHPCDPHAVCVSTGPGTYSCACTPGYRGNGHICSELNGCDGNPCKAPGVCETTGPGKYKCDCPAGYIVNGDECHKIVDHTVEQQFQAAQQAVEDLETVQREKIQTLEDIGRSAQVADINRAVSDMTKEKHRRQEYDQDNAINEVENRVNSVSHSVEELAEQTKEQSDQLKQIQEDNKRQAAVQKVLQLANLASLTRTGANGGAAAALAAAAAGGEGEGPDSSVLAAAALGAFRPAPYPSTNYQPQNPPAAYGSGLPSGLLIRPGPVPVANMPEGGPTGRLGNDHFYSDLHLRPVYYGGHHDAIPVFGDAGFVLPEVKSDEE